MNLKAVFTGTVLMVAALCASGQGTFLYDQQSSTDETPIPLASGTAYIGGMEQGFTPTLSSIDFVRVQLAGPGSPGVGDATAYLTLTTSSYGTPIATTATSVLPGGFVGPTTFFFPSSVSLAPGSEYFFRYYIQAPHTWYVGTGYYSYTGGNSTMGGLVLPGGQQYWFREGIIVPEPSSAVLLLLGGAAFVCLCRLRSPAKLGPGVRVVRSRAC